MADPIGDMSTRIRNGLHIESTYVEMPHSIMKSRIAEVLQKEGFIWDFEVYRVNDQCRSILRINLKYGPNGERVVRSIKRISKPGKRVFSACKDIPIVVGGMGICIVSTNKGLVSDSEARRMGLGGELILEVY